MCFGLVCVFILVFGFGFFFFVVDWLSFVGKTYVNCTNLLVNVILQAWTMTTKLFQKTLHKLQSTEVPLGLLFGAVICTQCGAPLLKQDLVQTD